MHPVPIMRHRIDESMNKFKRRRPPFEEDTPSSVARAENEPATRMLKKIICDYNILRFDNDGQLQQDRPMMFPHSRHMRALATERGRKLPSKDSINVLMCLFVVIPSLVLSFGLAPARRVQAQQYQRSSLHPQASLVNSNNNGLFYQNDQSQPPLPQRSSSNLQSSLYAENLPPQRQPFQSASQDQDNVIESTTTDKNLLQFPMISAALLHQHQHQHQQQQQQQQQQQLQLQPQPQQTCQLPHTWAGKWYQANKEQIRITNTDISDKGVCRDKKGDKYLFEYTRGQQTCLNCLVINERHLNVLQYKESTCQPIPAPYLNRSSVNGAGSQLTLDNDHLLLDKICSEITGDATLESLFRLDTPATECPISGKYHFSHDNCREPLSTLDSCIDKKQLHFKFSTCPDGTGSESKSEVLKCYADWSEGNNYYMIGRLEHATNAQDKGKFRCFVYEKMPDGEYIQMAQSLEESCYGLINANDGPKTLRLTPRAPTGNKCHFPSYIQSQSQDWLSVDNSLIYMFNQNSTKYQVKETKEGNVIEEATCLQQFTYNPPQIQVTTPSNQQARNSFNLVTTPSSRRHPPSSNHFNQIDLSVHQQSATSTARHALNDVVYLVQITKNCYTAEYCVRFYRRTNGIVQIDYFSAMSSGEGQHRCRNAYVSVPQTQIITSTNLEQQRCPFDGAYTIEAPIESDFSYNPSNIFICPRQSFLTAQCDYPSRLRIHYKCSPAKYMIKNLYCLGSWTTNGLVRLLLADDDRQRYSAWYRDYGSTGLVAPHNAQDEYEPTSASQGTTRSQHLIGLSAGANQYAANSLASVVDLQIALLAPQPIVAKAMQVRLTRRSQCSDLRGYTSQGSLASMSSASIPSYASPSAASSAAPAILNLFHPKNHRVYYGSTMMLMFTTSLSFFYTISLVAALSAANSLPYCGHMIRIN